MRSRTSYILAHPIVSWVITVAIILGGLFSLRPLRQDIHLFLMHPILAVELGVLIGAFVIGSSVLILPARHYKTASRWILGILLVWFCFLIFRMIKDPMALWGACTNGVSCSGSVILITILTSVFFIFISKKNNKPLTDQPIFYLIVSAFSLTAFEFVCASANPLHVILFHIVPTCISLAVLVGIFRWVGPNSGPVQNSSRKKLR